MKKKAVLPEVIKDLKKREKLGIKKYGTKLYVNSDRSALQDLYEELLDAAQYCKQELMRRDEEAKMWKYSIRMNKYMRVGKLSDAVK